MHTVNERNALEFTAAFFRDREVPSVPGSAHWRVDCQTTGTVLQDWTEETVVANYDEFGDPVEVTIAVEVPSSVNEIQDTRNRREVKELTIAANLGTETEFSETLVYVVVNRKRP